MGRQLLNARGLGDPAPAFVPGLTPGAMPAHDINSILSGMSDPPSCLKMAQQIYDFSHQAQSSQKAYLCSLGLVVGTPKVTLEVGGMNGATDVALGWSVAGYAQAVEIQEAAATAMRSFITLQFLALEYKNFGCFSNTWPDAPAVGPLQISSAGEYTCSDDTYEVVDEDAGTDYTVTVYDCEYAI